MTTAETPNSSFQTRVKSALVFAPVVLILLYFGGFGFTVMMAAAAGIGGFEWARMVLTGAAAPKGIAYLAAGALALSTVVAGMVGSAIVAFWFLLALCFLIFAYNFSQKGPSVKTLYAGLLYIGFSIAVMTCLRNFTVNGLYHMTTLLFIVWASDIFAYLTGKSLGGPKLAPAISPKKTWSGFIGSSLGAGAVAGAMACPWLTQKLDVTTIGGMQVMGYFIMAFFLAMVGQAGDLLISYFKRKHGIKDTGAIIPGHGGILDRIDALLLVSLFFGLIAFIAGT